jgi:hypothetical protein
MTRALVVAIALAGTGLLLGSAAVFGLRAPPSAAAIVPVWTEAKWPFPIDQWGTGSAFVCMPADCGAKVDLYVRPKIGFCNCATGVSDDAELERVADTELVSRKVRPRGAGHSVKVGWMNGLGRQYWTSDGETGTAVLSLAYNDGCDAVVAVATLGNGDPAALETAILAFLNTEPMVLWIKKELGLEFVKRVW